MGIIIYLRKVNQGNHLGEQYYGITKWNWRYTEEFLGAVFTIAAKWEQLQCPSKRRWTNQLWCIHILGCYSAMASEQLQLHKTWIESQNNTEWKQPSKENKLKGSFYTSFKSRQNYYEVWTWSRLEKKVMIIKVRTLFTFEKEEEYNWPKEVKEGFLECWQWFI